MWALVQACVQVARRAGKEAATLHTTEQMVAAQRIYPALGFRRDPSRDMELHPDLVLQAFRLPLRSLDEKVGITPGIQDRSAQAGTAGAGPVICVTRLLCR